MSKRKLLLADDSITIQKVVNLTFADEGIEVITVGDGDSAMEKFAEFTPDLVMADVNMPGLNGYEICEIIKRNESTSRIPVILLVGSFEPFDEEEANRVGANDFLTKPFQSIRQLVGKVTDLLNDGETAAVAEETAEQPAQKPTGFTATLEMPKEELASAVDLGDMGMDDEMIETNRVDDFSEEESGETEDDNLKTQALTAEEMREYSFTTDVGAVKEPVEETESEAATAETPVEETEETAETEDEETYAAQAGEDLAEEKGFGIVSDELRATEAETETYETAEETPPISEEEPETSQTEFEEEKAETYSTEASETISQEEAEVAESDESVETESSMTEEVAPISFDDADLLELPPLVEETGIRPSSDIVKTESEVSETEESQTVDASPQPAAFSPELIEAIANRVTEKLVNSVMKSLNTADVAEQIIKELKEEDLKK